MVFKRHVSNINKKIAKNTGHVSRLHKEMITVIVKFQNARLSAISYFYSR